MRFTQDLSSNANVIRGYGPGQLRINDRVYRESLILSRAAILAEPTLTDVEHLSTDHVASIQGLGPEVVLLGTGARQIFPHPWFGAAFLKAGIGFEVMDTGAACRTFNVLLGEQRQVVALLLV